MYEMRVARITFVWFDARVKKLMRPQQAVTEKCLPTQMTNFTGLRYAFMVVGLRLIAEAFLASFALDGKALAARVRVHMAAQMGNGRHEFVAQFALVAKCLAVVALQVAVQYDEIFEAAITGGTLEENGRSVRRHLVDDLTKFVFGGFVKFHQSRFFANDYSRVEHSGFSNTGQRRRVSVSNGHTRFVGGQWRKCTRRTIREGVTVQVDGAERNGTICEDGRLENGGKHWFPHLRIALDHHWRFDRNDPFGQWFDSTNKRVSQIPIGRTILIHFVHHKCVAFQLIRAHKLGDAHFALVQIPVNRRDMVGNSQCGGSLVVVIGFLGEFDLKAIGRSYYQHILFADTMHCRCRVCWLDLLR